MKQVLEF